MPSNNVRYANYPERVRIRKWLLATQTHCALCGGEIDKDLKCPHPDSAVVDEIIPVSLGGSPIDPNNVQLAHWKCNARKGAAILPTEDSKAKGSQRAHKPPRTQDLATRQSRQWI